MDHSNKDADTEIELEWEEWDGTSPFHHHCIAGSVAGVAEHVLLYPVDTIKTHMQSYCVDCPHNPNNKMSKNMSPIVSSSPTAMPSSFSSKSSSSMWRTVRNLVVHGYTHSPTATASNYSRGPASSASYFSQTVGCVNQGNINTASATVGDIIKSSSKAAQPIADSPSILRLWRGVQTMALGCIPAHALYFSSYEAVKAMFLEEQKAKITDGPNNNNHSPSHLSPIGSSAAGATATFFHDLIMTPLDTVKQRLQLGHYQGMMNGFQEIVKCEGYSSLYRSFPVTLMTNIPYGILMVSTNEFLKEALLPFSNNQNLIQHRHQHNLDLYVCLLAGSGAGFIASALTTPLDRVKTRLQTQRLGSMIPTSSAMAPGTTVSDTTKCKKRVMTNTCPKANRISALQKQAHVTSAVNGIRSSGATNVTENGANIALNSNVYGLNGGGAAQYEGLKDAFKSIIREEGTIGLFRGMIPRILLHTPAVAISWTSYEAAKKWLMDNSKSHPY